MNLFDYGDASFCITDVLHKKLCDSDAKYVRIDMQSKTSGLSYRVEQPVNIDGNDYIIRLEHSSNLVISSQLYSHLYGKQIGIKEGLTGTELFIK
jgi:hypothetical protein